MIKTIAWQRLIWPSVLPALAAGLDHFHANWGERSKCLKCPARPRLSSPWVRCTVHVGGGRLRFSFWSCNQVHSGTDSNAEPIYM